MGCVPRATTHADSCILKTRESRLKIYDPVTDTAIATARPQTIE
jgi:hypothetical protein